MGIVAKNIDKRIGDPPTQVLFDISADIERGEFVALTGRSGSGKSTLMYILSSLDSPSSGTVEIDGYDIETMPSEELHRFRNLNMGFVFQFHYLLAELTALENVLMPTLKFNQRERRRSLAEGLLEQFGLKDKVHRQPRQLSGGEQQRVAIARALVMEPAYLFADEPTGSLDTLNGDLVMKILSDTNRDKGATIVMVTHDPDFADMARRKIHLSDGRVVGAD